MHKWHPLLDVHLAKTHCLPLAEMMGVSRGRLCRKGLLQCHQPQTRAWPLSSLPLLQGSDGGTQCHSDTLPPLARPCAPSAARATWSSLAAFSAHLPGRSLSPWLTVVQQREVTPLACWPPKPPHSRQSKKEDATASTRNKRHDSCPQGTNTQGHRPWGGYQSWKVRPQYWHHQEEPSECIGASNGTRV